MYDKMMITCFLIGNVMVIGLMVLLLVWACWFGSYLVANRFHYPYFHQDFDVSRRRNIDIVNEIEAYLCEPSNWAKLCQHQREIALWKEKSLAKLVVMEQEAKGSAIRTRIYESCKRQYESILDDNCAFRFTTSRNRQSGYIVDNQMDVSFAWLVEKHKELAGISFETTLKNYHVKNQRRLMTRALREEIMKRDNYTCQICGKYMPDEVGLHVDHIIPVSKGGKSVASNLQVLCSKCNGRKGTKVWNS